MNHEIHNNSYILMFTHLIKRAACGILCSMFLPIIFL